MRIEDEAGVEAFARGCMRTYLILAERARELGEDEEFAAALQAAQAHRLAEPTVGAYSPDAAQALREEAFDAEALAARGAGHERVDQRLVERLLGL
jgi:xylose isomerase